MCEGQSALVKKAGWAADSRMSSLGWLWLSVGQGPRVLAELCEEGSSDFPVPGSQRLDSGTVESELGQGWTASEATERKPGVSLWLPALPGAGSLQKLPALSQGSVA